MHPYVPPQVQTADVIETETRQVDNEFAKLKAECDQISDAVTEQKNQNEITDLVEDIIDESNPFQNIDTEDIWIEDNIFDNNDNQNIADVSKDILKGIKESDQYLDLNIPSSFIIDDLFEPLDNENIEVNKPVDNDNVEVTAEELEDWDQFDQLDDEGPELVFPEPAVPQPDIIIPDANTVSMDTGPKQSKTFVATQMNSAVIAANKVQENIKNS